MIGVIVQARMTSRRFPGKVLADLAGKPVLQRVLERAKLIPFTDVVICTFPAQDASIPIYELANSMNVFCASGDENDVLKRYWDAASMYGLNEPDSIIVRVTADCPFLDPIVCGEVIALLKSDGFDYTSNVHPKRTYPRGLDCEAFTWDCLDAAQQRSKSVYEREHVTPWMQKAHGLKRGCVRQRQNHSDHNWCVDVPDDIPRLARMATNRDAALTAAIHHKKLTEMAVQNVRSN